MTKQRSGIKYYNKRLLQKYLVILFSLVLVFSPFSSLGELAHAEGDTDKVDSSEVNGQLNGNSTLESGEPGEDSDYVKTKLDDPNNESGTDHSENDGDSGSDDGEIKNKVNNNDFAVTLQNDPPNPTADGFEWKDNGDGTVTITGYTGNATDITIPSEIDGKTVTVLGQDSLKNKSLKQIQIPDTVTKIEREALRFNQFTHITLPSSLQELSDLALPGNPLESIEIDDSNQHFKTSADKKGLYTKDGETLILGTYHGSIEQGTKAIGNHAIFGTRLFEAKALTEVTIPDSVESIGRYSFAGNKLTEIVIPNSVTKIDSLAFQNNTIESITFSENLTSIGQQAFQNNKLTEIDLPESLKTIGSTAFKENKLESVALPSQLETIGFNAFEDNHISQITLPETIKVINSKTFANNNLEQVTIPASVENIYTEAFKNNKLNKVSILSADTKITDTAFDDNQDTAADLRIVSHDPSHAKDLADSKGYTFIQLADLTIIQQPDDFEVAYNTPLNELALPAEIDISYEGETKTVGVSWDNGSPEYNGETPGQYEFSGELQLEQGMTNPADAKASVTVTVSPYAWEDNTDVVTITGYYGNETSLTIPNSFDGKKVTVIGEEAFKQKNLTSVTIPSTVKEIEREAFRFNSLISINIPQSVETIGTWAFHSNNIEELDVPGTVKEIGANSFESNAIKTLTIGDGVETISNYAFSGNEITSISIPKSVSSIGRNPFQSNELASITVDGNNDHFKDIDGEGLYTKNGKELVAGTTSGKIVDGTEIIRMNAFGGIELTEIVIPESVTSIGREAFTRSNLEKITFKNKDTVINNTALRNYSNIDDLVIYGYTGSTAQAFALGENSYNKTLKFVPLEYEWTDDGNEVTITGYVGDEADITIPEEIAGMPVTIIGERVFSGIDLTSVILPKTLEQVGEFAFAANKLTSVTIPKSLTLIRPGAFAINPLETIEVADGNVVFWDSDEKGLYATDPLFGNILFQGTRSGEIADGTSIIADNAFYAVGLKGEVKIPNSVQYIGKFAFSNGEIREKINNISKVEIPGSVEEIGEGAFFNVGLEELIMHEGLEKIGSEAFSYNSLEHVEIPGSVKLIDTVAFDENSIQELILHEGLERIEENAFTDNLLTSLDIPSTVVYIGEQTFQNNNLEHLMLHEGLEEIGYEAFNKNSLMGVEIPSSVNKIWGNAFSNNNLEQVMIRAKSIDIGSTSFEGNQTNPADLTIYGYKDSDVESFANDEGYTFIPFPHQLPLDADEPYDFYSGEFIEIINSDGEVVGTIQMPDFDETSTLATARLIVRDVAEGDVTATGLEVAGQIVDIIFVSPEYDYDPDNPNEDEIINDEINELDEDFILSLRVNNDATGDIAMYHEIGHDHWKNVGGDIVGNFITATVTDFSKYGVFSEIKEEPIEPEEPVDPEEPIDPEEPVDPEEPTDPEEPVDPEEPTDPEVPVDPEEPTEPEDPTDPEVPVDPEDPVDSEEPTEPEDPTKDIDDDKDKVEVIEDEEKPELENGELPNTSTSMYNILLLGSLLLISGAISTIFIHRRNRISRIK